MAWLILGHRLILNQSQPLTGHSPFHIEMERIRIPRKEGQKWNWTSWNKITQVFPPKHFGGSREKISCPIKILPTFHPNQTTPKPILPPIFSLPFSIFLCLDHMNSDHCAPIYTLYRNFLTWYFGKYSFGQLPLINNSLDQFERSLNAIEITKPFWGLLDKRNCLLQISCFQESVKQFVYDTSLTQ